MALLLILSGSLSCAYGRENALVRTIQTLVDDIQRGDSYKNDSN